MFISVILFDTKKINIVKIDVPFMRCLILFSQHQEGIKITSISLCLNHEPRFSNHANICLDKMESNDWVRSVFRPPNFVTLFSRNQWKRKMKRTTYFLPKMALSTCDLILLQSCFCNIFSAVKIYAQVSRYFVEFFLWVVSKECLSYECYTDPYINGIKNSESWNRFWFFTIKRNVV